MKNILILGANSAIAQEFISIRATSGIHFILVSRNIEKLKVTQKHIRTISKATVDIYSFDISNIHKQNDFFKKIIVKTNPIDLVFIASGTMIEQKDCEQDIHEVEFQLKNNFVSIACFLNLIAQELIKQTFGNIAVITSVAGDRGRPKNYIYGSAKAGLSAYLSGLRAKLYHFNIHVLEIKPGFTDTPMTSHLKKSILTVPANKVAKDISQAINQRKDILYTPSFWSIIMFLIRMIPERIFKKMNL